jgi:ribonuclease P/MRP protein subunit POP5
MDSIWASLIKLYGEHGASQAKLKLIDYDFEKKSAMLRTTNAALEMTRVALASVTKINSKPVGLHVLSVSGTIKSLNSKRTRNYAEST